MNQIQTQKRLNVSDTIYEYWVNIEDFNKIKEGYLPKEIWANGAGAVLQGKEEYYNKVTGTRFLPEWRLKEEYKDTKFEGLTHQFILESIFDEDGINKGFLNLMKMLRQQ